MIALQFGLSQPSPMKDHRQPGVESLLKRQADAF
jgi:hypothetical protein